MNPANLGIVVCQDKKQFFWYTTYLTSDVHVKDLPYSSSVNLNMTLSSCDCLELLR